MRNPQLRDDQHNERKVRERENDAKNLGALGSRLVLGHPSCGRVDRGPSFRHRNDLRGLSRGSFGGRNDNKDHWRSRPGPIPSGDRNSSDGGQEIL